MTKRRFLLLLIGMLLLVLVSVMLLSPRALEPVKANEALFVEPVADGVTEPDSKERLVIKIVQPFDIDHPIAIALNMQFKAAMMKQLGAIVEIYSEETLGGEVNCYGGLRNGSVTLAFLWDSLLPIAEQLSAFEGPFIASGTKELTAYTNRGFTDAFAEKFSENGIVPLMVGFSGIRQINLFSRGDLIAYHIACDYTSGNAYYQDVRFAPVSMSYRDIMLYNGGISVDGFDAPLVDWINDDTEAVKKVIRTNHQAIPFLVCANEKFLASLPQEDQDILLAELRKALVAAYEEIERQEQAYLDQAVENAALVIASYDARSSPAWSAATACKQTIGEMLTE